MCTGRLAGPGLNRWACAGGQAGTGLSGWIAVYRWRSRAERIGLGRGPRLSRWVCTGGSPWKPTGARLGTVDLARSTVMCLHPGFRPMTKSGPAQALLCVDMVGGRTVFQKWLPSSLYC